MLGGNPEFARRKVEVSSEESGSFLGGNSKEQFCGVLFSSLLLPSFS